MKGVQTARTACFPATPASDHRYEAPRQVPPGGDTQFLSPLCPPLSGKAIKLCFSALPQTLPPRLDSAPVHRGQAFSISCCRSAEKYGDLGANPGGRWRRFRVRSEVGLVRGRRSAVMVPETETLEEELVWEKMLSLVLGACGCPAGVQVWDLGLEKGLSRMHQTEMGAPRGRGSDHCRAQLRSLRGLSAHSGSHGPLDGLGTRRERSELRKLTASCQAVPGTSEACLTTSVQQPSRSSPPFQQTGKQPCSEAVGPPEVMWGWAAEAGLTPTSGQVQHPDRVPRQPPASSSAVNRGCLHCVLPGGF